MYPGGSSCNSPELPAQPALLFVFCSKPTRCPTAPHISPGRVLANVEPSSVGNKRVDSSDEAVERVSDLVDVVADAFSELELAAP